VPRSYVHEARKRVGPKKERIRPIIERLAVEHADATIALTFRSELELLVSVMLSAQTTCERRPRDRHAVRSTTRRTIWQWRRGGGRSSRPAFRQKGGSLRGTMRMLIEEFDGEYRAPRRLMRLPAWRARRRTSLRPSPVTRRIVVDTHVRRLAAARLMRQEDPVIERDHQAQPRDDWARSLPADLARLPRLRCALPRCGTVSSTISAYRAAR
jgi:endonuclease III